MLISIIVPVYNTERYLSKCVDSILAQTYIDFELLLIDDGSTDKSGVMCDEYARKDSRIRVFHKANGGASSARNVGIKNARGEWVSFIDSDDTVPFSYVNDYLQEITDDTDLIVAKYQVLDYSGNIELIYGKYKNKSFSHSEFLKELFCQKSGEYQGYMCNKFFRYSVLRNHNITFNESIFYNEDRLFIVQYICASKSLIKYIDASPYNYFLRPDSAMGLLEQRHVKQFVTDFDAFVLMKKEIERLPARKELRPQIIQGLVDSYYCNLGMMAKFKDYNPRTHWHMFIGLVKNGAFFLWLNICLRRLAIMLFHFLRIRK